MRTLTKILAPTVLAAGALLPAAVRAQPVDVQPPMPNVLIMLDTSGSMSRKMGSEDFPNCSLTGAAAREDLNQSRWFAVVQALTGTIHEDHIGCARIERTGEPFESLYGSSMYDEGYYIPFFQLQSNRCAFVPRQNADTWHGQWERFEPNDIIIQDPFNSSTSCDWRQNDNGIIDVYKGLVRFGLMTFDPLVGAEVQLTGNPRVADPVAGSRGSYSYWFSTDDDWNVASDRIGSWKSPTHAGHAVGRPPACEDDQEMEVGARGPAAPPWEGRLMGFGDYRALPSVVRESNENVEKVILTARPFGATPLAGMFSDAADFILNDDTTCDPLGADREIPLGPRSDDLWRRGRGCRPFHVILITDGEPNLDLLPDCATGDGVCPFPSIVDSPLYAGHSGDASTVNILAGEDPEGFNIKFHVVGVALSELTDPDAAFPLCSDYRTDGPGEARCGDPNARPQEKTCCLLNAVAEVGGTEQARFASSTEEVRTALSEVLQELSEGTASRTTPVYQPVAPTFHVGDTDANAVGHEILSSLKTTVGAGMWNGRLERVRFSCAVVEDGPVRAAFDRTLGDDFDDNLSIDPAERFMFTVVPEDEDRAWGTIRPHISSADAAADGMGATDVTLYADRAAAWSGQVPVDVIEPTNCTETFQASSPEECSERLLRWYTGQTNPAGPSRAPDTSDRDNSPSPMGAIYNSQPVVVGPPREFVRDEAYDVFAQAHAARPTVVYAATIDGQLHAFLLADNTARLATHEDVQADALENNELWSFVPPIVLPHLTDHVDTNAFLLDGGITVKNIAFERTAAAIGGTTAEYVDLVDYRTAMVVSSGNASNIPGGGYYFALDVTDPHPDPQDFDGDDDDEPRFDSPKFLWQLSRFGGASNIHEGPTNGRNPTSLFGESLPAAAIASIAYVDPDDEGETPPKEIAVAILAGGRSPAPTTTTAASFNAEALYDGPEESTPRTSVRDWGTGRADRSLTIVRIDTGEILWRFVGQEDDPKGVVDDRVRTVGFHAPISGTPVAFPGLPGQVSSRIFVGDAEGMLWEVDLTNPNPEDWTMKIAWDPYRTVTVPQIASGDVVPGPVETVPIVSVNDAGDPVVIFATGSQESFYQNVGKNFVVSLTGRLEGGYDSNWELDLEATPNLGGAVFTQGSDAQITDFGAPGQRVTGPLNLFDGVVYFATFVPNEDACLVGTSRIWGVDYIAADAQKQPLAAWDPNPDEEDGDEYFEQDDSAIVFGVAIGQEPSCRNSAEETIEDPIFGRYTTFETAPPGRFQLVVQTGRKLGGGGSTPDQPSTRTRDWVLRAPASTVRIDGWAAVVE